MKKIITFYCLWISIQAFTQNIPKLSIKEGGEFVKLSKVAIKANIVGNTLTTEYKLTFFNNSDRLLEGELQFPLGEGQAVSGFAMSLNGKLRDAVVVEKELARVAYENTIRQKIDPALLEKTNGNNYKARVYPILPNKEKVIVVTCEEKLSYLNGDLIHNFPIKFSEKLNKFDFCLTIEGNLTNKLKLTNKKFENIIFTEKETKQIAVIKNTNKRIDDLLKLVISGKENKEKVTTYKDYFNVYIPFKGKLRSKEKPKKITILWDVSGSMKLKNLEKEIALLEAYLKYLENVTIEFITFSSTVHTKENFLIKNGNWIALKSKIKKQEYDGGTNLNEVLKNIKTDAKEILLFSDGLHNLRQQNTEGTKKTIYVVNSLLSANHEYLKTISETSGGTYVNLNKLPINKATELLTKECLQLLGIKENNKTFEVYPKEKVTINNGIEVAGRFKRPTSIKLLLGYQDKVIEEKEVLIKKTPNSSIVKRLWAKQRLVHLNKSKQQNKKEIIELAKQYHLITDYTSMLVLDRVEDYVTYEITPPEELKEAYKRLLKEKKERENDLDIQDRKEELTDDYKDILKWYDASYVIKEAKENRRQTTVENSIIQPQVLEQNENVEEEIKGQEVEIIKQEEETLLVEKVDVLNESDLPKKTIHGLVKDENGPLPGVTVIVKGTMSGTETDFDGKFSINVAEGNELVFSFVGMETKEVVVGNTTNNLDIKLENDESVLQEVVVTAYASTVKRHSVSYALSSVTSGVKVDSKKLTKEETASNANVSVVKMETNPMYILDGERTDNDPLSVLKSNEVFEVEVLKAQDGIKLFGAEAKNGVVIVVTKEGIKNNKNKIEGLNEKIEELIELKSWDATMPYLTILNNEKTIKEAYKKYLRIKKDFSNSPMFFIDVADFFIGKGEKEIGVRVLTNLIEIELDNYELLKALAYKLEALKKYNLAVSVYEKILELRPEEPQSYRDLALAYEFVGDYSKSFKLLFSIYNGDLLHKDIDERFFGIEAIAFVELTRLVNTYSDKLKLNKYQKGLFKRVTPDIRVVVDWNHNDTDLDLWVIDPNGEKAYYGNKNTKTGGRMSEDLTEGYGPESFMIKNAIKGTYQIKVDYYVDTMQKISGPTILKVTTFENYGKKNEKRKVKLFKLDKEEDVLHIGNIVVN
ncbi:TonB-dependent SusC/RagA subfamily outer membrane receptor [Tenacibaculum sp. 190524A02b]|uniref:TonB-dependent SusC/RagA subfamily outer membrane receptor n=1 Tax=Tenacibaculum vairaonense TaxID=3137860 RepID=A0ABP1FG99_9FLAO